MDFDTSEIKKSGIYYLVIILVLVLVLIHVIKTQRSELSGHGKRKNADGNGDIYYLGRGSKNDSTAELLDRIDWASYLDKRVTKWQRTFMITLIVMILVILIVLRKIPAPSTFILLFVAIFIPIYASNNMLYVHGDMYNDHYIKNNVTLLRQKLGLKKNLPSEPKSDAPDRVSLI